MYWWDSLCMRSRSPWPVSATSGERSRNASATPVTRLVAPGPERAEADAGALGQAAVHVRHVGAALLVANRNEVDRRVGERLVEVERLLARDAEDVLDALHLQAFHEQVRRLALHIPETSPLRSCRANVAVHRVLHARSDPLPRPSSSLCLLPLGSARAASSKFTIRGAGFGHGVGMSQYGAYGFAAERLGLPRHPRPLLHGHGDREPRPEPARARAAAVHERHRLLQRRDAAPGAARLTARKTYYVRRRGAAGRSCSRRGASGWAPTRRCTSRAAAARCVLRGRAANGRVSGAYRGALDFRAGAFSGVDAINALPLDSYVQGVVPDESPAVVADRGAQGPGRRRPHLRGRDDEAGGDLRPLPRHALAGLRRRGGRGGLDEPGGAPRPAARSSPTTASRS